MNNSHITHLHHVGIVVEDVVTSAAIYENSMGARIVSGPFVDETQRVKVIFITTGSDISIELIEPLSDDSPVSNFLRQGGGLNHLCYEVNDMEGALQHARSQGAIIVRDPVPAVAFDGRLIAFVLPRTRILTEFLETASYADQTSS